MIFIDYSIDEGFYWKLYKDKEIPRVIREHKEISGMEDITKLLGEAANGRYIRAKISLVTWDREVSLETDFEGWKKILMELDKYMAEHETEKWIGKFYIFEDNEGNMVIKTTLLIQREKLEKAIEIARKHIRPTVEYRFKRKKEE